MAMTGELQDIAEEVVDEDLSLLLVKGNGVPRLGIFNTRANKKKFVHLSWVECAGRSLKIKAGKVGTKEYPMENIRESILRLFGKAEKPLSLNSLVWRGVQLLGDLMHVPKGVRNETDTKLIPEKKRDALWFAYTPRDEAWKVLPCFLPTEEELPILDSHLVDGPPWRGFPVQPGELPFSMRNEGIAKELFNANSRRWTEPLLPISKGLLLGFSDWSMNGEHTFGDALWSRLPTPDFRSEESLVGLAASGRLFISRLTAYMRLWPVFERARLEWVVDSTKVSEERNFKKRERFEMVSPRLNDKRFKVTRFVDEESRTAFGIVPETRLPGEMDRFITLDMADWEACMEACALGGEKDPQYTCTSVIWGFETKAWYEDLRHCVLG